MKALTAIIASLLVTGCSSSPRPQANVVMPTFDWSPPATAVPASAGVNFGVVGGTYAQGGEWTKQYPFDRFAGNMGRDFVELLSAKGFTTTGPFASLNEMTYGDKKGCDLVIVPELDVDAVPTAATELHVAIIGDNYYTASGQVTVRGRVTLSVLESLSGTRMWNKSIELAQNTVPWKGERHYSEKAYPGGPPATAIDVNDPGLLNAVAPALEQAYLDILGNAWTYLDPEEMKTVKTQASEVREKTTFQGK